MKISSLFVGSLVSALVLFVWGYLFWNVLPFSENSIQRLSGESQVLVEQLQLSEGMTIFPHPSDLTSDVQHGPYLEISYSADVRYLDPKVFAAGLLHYFVAAILFGILLDMARGALPDYASRVAFGLVFGLAATVLLNLGEPIWFHRSWQYALGVAGYDLGMGLLLGLVQGRFIKPRVAQALV